MKKLFGILSSVDETARAVAGVAEGIVLGVAGEVRDVKRIAMMARSLAREIGWSGMAKIIGEVIAERIG